MAFLNIEGFDNVNWVDQLLEKPGTVAENSAGFALSTSYSRWPTGRGMRGTTDGNYFRRSFKAVSEVWAGVALAKGESGSPSYSSGSPFLSIRDTSNNINVRVHVMADHSLDVYGPGGLLGSSVAGAVPSGVSAWWYCEIRVKCHDTLGEVEVRVNEQTVVNVSGVDTNAGVGVCSQMELRCMAASIITWFDDLYVDDAQFHGNVRVRTVYPDSDSATHTDFERSGGSNDYECVDEDNPNDDTDYIKSSTKGHKSTFGVTTGALGVVKAIQFNHRVKAATPGLRRLKPLIRSGGADYNGEVSGVIPSGDYSFKVGPVFTTDPDDGQPWDQTKLEAGEFGLLLVDGTTTTSTSTTTTAP